MATSRAWRNGLVAGLVLLGLAGCSSSGRPATTTSSAPPARLVAEARPIGSGPAFQPPVSGRVLGPCASRLGTRFGVHVEVFGANRVVLVPAGIGTKPPRRFMSGRISSAGCYGRLVTLEPTGLVLVRAGARPVLADLFRSWGEPLSPRRVASFAALPGDTVHVYVDGRRWLGPPARVPLRAHSEIVLEVGPYVPPHSAYTFPPGL